MQEHILDSTPPSNGPAPPLHHAHHHTHHLANGQPDMSFTAQMTMGVNVGNNATPPSPSVGGSNDPTPPWQQHEHMDPSAPPTSASAASTNGEAFPNLPPSPSSMATPSSGGHTHSSGLTSTSTASELDQTEVVSSSVSELMGAGGPGGGMDLGAMTGMGDVDSLGGGPGGGGGGGSKKSSSRKNAWGNMSYADLITQAIQSAPDMRLTLSQVYEWMVQNIPYFKDKGDSNSSAGWKVSRFVVF